MMVSTLTTKGVSIRLTPMQISETPSSGGGGLGEAEVTSADRWAAIDVHPGELCRVALEIKNEESQPQTLTLKLDGTFPLHWCHVKAEASSAMNSTEIVSDQDSDEPSLGTEIDLETVEVPAKKSWHTDLWFLVPQDFFEGQEALQENNKNFLSPTFAGCLSVYANQSSRQGLRQTAIEQSDFVLNIQPRSDYTAFLPTVYQEVDFIHHFIKIFEQAFDPVVNSFNSMWANLDPLTAPQSLIPFLAHWVDWPIDSQLGLLQQRKLIRRAVEIYRWRGTRKGLRFYLHLYTGLPLDEELIQEEDKSISITEPFGQGCIFGVAHVGKDAVIGGGKPYHFRVRLRTNPDNPIDEQLVRRILDREKPVFCTYDLWIETIQKDPINSAFDPPNPP
jgi:phage tail-like protein